MNSFILDEIKSFIKDCQDDFYHQRLLKLNIVTFNDVLQRINPYLLKATDKQSAPGLIEDILATIISSSDEKIFVDSFIEPLAIRIGFRNCSSGEYIDIAGEENAYSVKQKLHIHSGQAFWEELTGDADFYLKIIRMMHDYPQHHRVEYCDAYNQALNRFTKEFLDNFSTTDGAIDWEKLVKYNSGKLPMKL